MTRKDFKQVTWDAETIDDCRQLIRLAVREDLGRGFDLTTVALVPHDSRGKADIVCREPGVIAGLPAAECVLREMNADIQWHALVDDGTRVEPGTTVATLAGSTRDLLTAERPVLNFLGKLSGIATLTRRYIDQVAHTRARIYDTRKTTPGWRRLEKYAVRCGGGTNHRTGLSDAILIKDNHLGARKVESSGCDLHRTCLPRQARSGHSQPPACVGRNRSRHARPIVRSADCRPGYRLVGQYELR